MQEAIVELINQFGYFGVFLLIAIENVFPPIPSEIILTFSGFMTTQTSMQIWGVVLAATAGSLAGAFVLYWVGRLLNADRLKQLAESKVGKILRFKVSDIEKAESWFTKHGNKTVFFCRFIPIVRSLISIPAGMARMNIAAFVAFTTAGTLIWNTVLVTLGMLMGNAWGVVAGYVDTYAFIIAIVLIAAALIILVLYIRNRFCAKKPVRK